MKLLTAIALSLGFAAAQGSETFGVDRQVRKSGDQKINKKLLSQKCLSNECDISYKKFAQIATKSGFDKSIFAKCDKKWQKCTPKKSTEAVFENFKKCVGLTSMLRDTKQFKKMNKKKQKKIAAKNRAKCNKHLMGYLKCRHSDPKDECRQQKSITEDFIVENCKEIKETDSLYDKLGCEFVVGSDWIPIPPVVNITDKIDLSKEIKCGVRADKETSNLYDPNDPGRWWASESRILGGENADEGEFPWQVSLREVLKDGTLWHFCGGSIIDRYTILTAAHCFDDMNPSRPFYVLGGLVKNYRKSAEDLKKIYQDDIDNFGTFIQEINPNEKKGQVIVHEKYNYFLSNRFGVAFLQNDIALVKLAKELDYPKYADSSSDDVNRKEYVGSLIRPICLPDTEKLIPALIERTNSFLKKTKSPKKIAKLSKRLNFWENKNQKKSVLKMIEEDLPKQKKRELAKIKKQLKKAKKNGNKKKVKKLQKVLGAIQDTEDSKFCDIENSLKKNPYWITGWGRYDVKTYDGQIVSPSPIGTVRSFVSFIPR